MVINFESTQQRNHSSTTIQTLGRVKPFYIANGMSNYESGSINVVFIQFVKNKEFIDNIMKEGIEI